MGLQELLEVLVLLEILLPVLLVLQEWTDKQDRPVPQDQSALDRQGRQAIPELWVLKVLQVRMLREVQDILALLGIRDIPAPRVKQAILV